MIDRTLGIIYTIKQKGTDDATIMHFLQKYSNTTYPFTREEIDQILRETCANFIEGADNPIQEIHRYFLSSSIFSHIGISEHDRMINFLQQTQISSNGKYINGFKEWKEE